ncbi:Holliday junction resolvase RuvX [Candidatus Williamhamiltonella defendens]|uniref:Holliday junction resolvase RuvX n=1 Tax=Candidatus Williamhamiltonella defendens TaxID=138072 RepID=UPI00130D600C|nr:Holliday junction resolvase RuvX [Candidatus Hamiltonella defensa]
MRWANIIAFDFGTKSIGVAIGQNITETARPLTACKSKNGTPDWIKIERLLSEWYPDLVVVGFPLNMDGTQQPITESARQFGHALYRRFGINVIFHDERLSTVEARAYLFDKGGYHALNKSSVDATSAFIILESWFSSNKAQDRIL